jgi:8-oxo-dGTP pyrophosphatase MutT (NUDIX family)
MSSEAKFENAHLTVTIERVRTPSRERTWTTVHRKAAVVIAAITAKSKIVLINQERVSIRAAIWEMPAGQIDRPADEDGKEAREVALRELREETGYELAPGGELIALGDFFSSPGFTDERELLFAAKPVRCSPDGHAHDESETIYECREFSVAEIQRMIADNTIRDANTLSAWARLLARKIIVPT